MINLLLKIWAAKPGFPFVVVSCRLVFVGVHGSSFVSHRPPTKKSGGISPSYHSNPCRKLKTGLLEVKIWKL